MVFRSFAILIFLAQSSWAEVDFVREIQPVLEKKCLGCHNANLTKGDVNLDNAASVLKKHLVPGKALQSDIYLVATPEEPGEKPEMPDEGEPLTDAEAEMLRKWIDEGANWPDGLVLKEASKADKTWWAYQKLTKPKLDSIDAFIDEKLAEKGLMRNLKANRRDLLRRVTYDLTGLPPTIEEMSAFEKDTDPKAWEKVIDRLLASPRYGERWGRHWLDVVRFGESRGYERNVIIDNIWPFRDYVINSINDDKPFNQFITEHLAGDVVGKGNPNIEVATAFLVAGPYDDVGNQDAAQKNIIRANTLDGMITATGSAFLGLTVNCAKCHDHKFDPIEQADYYRLRATFEGVKQGERTIATPAAAKAHQDAVVPLKKVVDEMTPLVSKREADLLAQARAKPDVLRKTTRAKMDRTGTEDSFKPILAKFVRLSPFSNDTSPAKNGIRLDEFEVWSAEKTPRNVALASNGGIATGAGRAVQDSTDNAANAYGAGLVNDGNFGRRWISAGNHQLTIEFSKPERINKVVFSSDRPKDLPGHSKMTFVGEYRIEVSEDGENWTRVAESWDREPINKAFENSRLMRFGVSDSDKAELAKMKGELGAANAKLRAVQPLPIMWAGNFVQPDKPTHLAIGGDPNKAGIEIVPASLSMVSAGIPKFTNDSKTPEAERRHAMAKWIAHQDNPLTLRVLANRVWHYHFGTGIVATPSDFGYMGARPTHPELLDYLALQLQENGWRWKPLHREILLSETYQQSTDFDEKAAAVDSDSRLLWRFPPRRLSAEEIRDTMLTVAGKLDLTMGGPGFRLYKFTQDNVCTYFPLDVHGAETWRRGVYHQNPRAAQLDLLTEFDCPDPATATPRRASTTTPLQALTLMNHSFTVEMAGFFAERVGKGNAETGAQIDNAFELIFGRKPTEQERTASAKLVSEHGLKALSRALFNSNELIFLN